MADNVLTIALLGPGQVNGVVAAEALIPALQPGTTTITLTNAPTHLRAVSAWVTERYPGLGFPKIGSAVISTSSVQYDAQLGSIRIVCSSSWSTPLEAAVMMILG